ncbi:LamG domain-containing protein [Streptomyces sp. NPDC005562]|uniref:LamG domain-containing protein n=1 Tax=Streptomyces sp. NPDC005562 TaxID=3154890 RepID=UPI0033B40AD1
MRHAFARCALAVVLGSSAVVATPWLAAAVENRPPDQPARADLRTGDAPCASGADRAYVRRAPVLSATLRDPDPVPPPSRARLTAEFEVSWQDAAGERQVRSGRTGPSYIDRPVTWTAPEDVPAATEVSWRVRAFDGTAWGPWSSDGATGGCAFVVDKERPARPTVSSAQYPDDGKWHDGVGVRGTFEAASASPDTAKYVYTFMGDTPETVVPERLGGPVRFSRLPERSGPTSVTVEAVDRAGNRSEEATYRFRVDEGSKPVAHWKLADPAGSTEASAEVGGRPAAAGGGVTFGAEGPARTAVDRATELDGSAGAYLSSGAPAVDTGKAFSVSAWVRPDEAGRAMAAVSQDGTGTAAYRLGTDGDGAWSFALGGPGGTVVRAKGGTPESGEWAHLTGVYDAGAKTAALYVNGRRVDSVEDAPAPAGSGAAQVGRALGAAGQGANWDGRIADVRAWSRVVVSEEAAKLAGREAVRTGHWRFDEAAGRTSPEQGGGQPMRLGGDALIRHDDQACDPLDPECGPGNPPIVGEGELVLDGAGDFAATDGPAVATDDSFSLAAHVRIDPAAENRTMTLLSLPGENTGLATLRYTPERRAWELTLAHEDRAGAETTTLRADGARRGVPQHLAVVYDDGADEVLLYVDGSVRARAPFHHMWRATGGLQAGRAPVADGWGEFLTGAVDDVHAFAGAVSEQEVSAMAVEG